MPGQRLPRARFAIRYGHDIGIARGDVLDEAGLRELIARRREAEESAG